MSRLISIIIAAFSLCISLIFLVSSYFCSSIVINPSKTLGFWGILVSAVALVVACYFVILAIDAYGYVSRVRAALRSIEETQRNLEASRYNLATSLWDSYTLQYNLLSLDEDEDEN